MNLETKMLIYYSSLRARIRERFSSFHAQRINSSI
jgi:hypothetical protein